MRTVITEGYSPGCIGRITSLHADHYSAEHGFGVAFEARVARDLSDFCLSYKTGCDGLWLVRGTEIEGSIAIHGARAPDQSAHLRWFILSGVMRGQGIGRQLLERALDFSDACGYKHLHLSTFEGLDPARHLYEAYGFKLAHQEAGNHWGTVVQEQRFERSMAPATGTSR
jgi:GNAT superfamily N-acetyltransferase